MCIYIYILYIVLRYFGCWILFRPSSKVTKPWKWSETPKALVTTITGRCVAPVNLVNGKLLWIQHDAMECVLILFLLDHVGSCWINGSPMFVFCVVLYICCINAALGSASNPVYHGGTGVGLRPSKIVNTSNCRMDAPQQMLWTSYNQTNSDIMCMNSNMVLYKYHRDSLVLVCSLSKVLVWQLLLHCRLNIKWLLSFAGVVLVPNVLDFQWIFNDICGFNTSWYFCCIEVCCGSAMSKDFMAMVSDGGFQKMGKSMINWWIVAHGSFILFFSSFFCSVIGGVITVGVNFMGPRGKSRGI